MSDQEQFAEQTWKKIKKTKRSLKRLCRLWKERAGRERMIKAYESFCRAFGEMKAYAISYLFVFKISAAEVMEVRTEVKHVMLAKMELREHFAELYHAHGRDLTKSDKSAERKFIRTHRMLSQELSKMKFDGEGDLEEVREFCGEH